MHVVRIAEASEYGPMPPQPSRAPSGGLAGEVDDLTLNIWAPTNARNAPVLVWLPGGAYYPCMLPRVGTTAAALQARASSWSPSTTASVSTASWPSTACSQSLAHSSALNIKPTSHFLYLNYFCNLLCSERICYCTPMAQGLFHKAIAQSPPQNHLTLAQAQRIASATAETLKVAPTPQALASVPLA